MQPAWNNGQGYTQPYPYYGPSVQQAGYSNPYYAYGASGQAASTGPAGQVVVPRPRHSNSNGNGTLPFPEGGESTSVGPAGHTPMPRPKHLSRSQTPGPGIPLRSAMKKGRSTSGASAPLTRERTPSDSRQRGSFIARRRTNSMPHFVPDHIFLSFHGSNEFRLENVHRATLEHVQEQILSMWPHGVESVSNQGYQWRARFTRNPWSCNGLDAILARRMILNIFNVLTRHGYNYLTSVDLASPTPRLVFVDTEADRPTAKFFLASFSRGGHKVTLIDPPAHIGESIGESLRLSLPHKIASDRVSEDGIYTVELKRNAFGAAGVDKNLFVSHVLKQINAMGGRLEAAVPLAKSGLFGLGSRKEIWVFKERSSWRSGTT